MKRMETLPQCDFIWMVTEREEEEKKEERKSYTASKGKKIRMAMELPKETSNQAWKTLSSEALYTTETYGKFVSCLLLFFKRTTTRRYFKELLLPFHSLPPFPKHDEQVKEPCKGRCRLGSPLSFYLPSPHASLLKLLPPTPHPDYLTQLCPLTPACFGQSGLRGKGMETCL